jgi:hypothetical protein
MSTTDKDVPSDSSEAGSVTPEVVGAKQFTPAEETL